MSRTAVALLSTKNLLHNLSVIRARARPAKIIAMVKANAYGHGLRSVSLRLDGQVDALGVASIDEALALRKVGVKSPIILMQGVFEASELTLAAEQKFQVVFHHAEQLQWLQENNLSESIEAWVKIDTGMGRLGFDAQEASSVIKTLNACPRIQLPVRILSHLACADNIHHPLNMKQIETFQAATLHQTGEKSLCNSAGIFNFPEVHYDYVRSGLALYGVSPLKHKTAAELDLKPVMTLQSTLISVNLLKKGSYVGYGATYCCEEDMPVGIIAFGYGDGYPLTSRDGTPVLIHQTECPLIGRVYMDMMTVDLRPCPKAQIGDTVILWGEALPVERISEYTANSTWNMLAGIQHRVKFIWIDILTAFEEAG